MTYVMLHMSVQIREGIGGKEYRVVVTIIGKCTLPSLTHISSQPTRDGVREIFDWKISYISRKAYQYHSLFSSRMCLLHMQLEAINKQHLPIANQI